MNTSFLATTLIAASALLNLAHAADGTINVSGAISDSTCKINGAIQNGSAVATLTIALPTVAKADFAMAGKTGPIVTGTTGSASNITLTSCPASVTVKLSMDGNGSNINAATNSYKSTSGTSTNMSAQIMNAEDGSVLDPFGNTAISKITDASGNATFLLGTRYYSLGATTAGTFNTTAGFNITYQ